MLVLIKLDKKENKGNIGEWLFKLLKERISLSLFGISRKFLSAVYQYLYNLMRFANCFSLYYCQKFHNCFSCQLTNYCIIYEVGFNLLQNLFSLFHVNLLINATSLFSSRLFNLVLANAGLDRNVPMNVNGCFYWGKQQASLKIYNLNYLLTTIQKVIVTRTNDVDAFISCFCLHCNRPIPCCYLEVSISFIKCLFFA